MFSQLPDAALQELAERLEHQEQPAGRVIFRQGDPGESLYVIHSGDIAISVPDDDGSESAIDELGPGQFFGELSLLDGLSRSVTATATSDAELLVLSRPKFLGVLRQERVLEHVLPALAQRLRGADQQLSATGQDNRKLREEARTDPLTQLGNRRSLQEDLETLTARARRYGQPYSVAMCDIDHFKRYNDSCGHAAGDEVLRAVAQAIAQTCRTGDAVYRYGGEEFVVVLPQQSAEAAAIGLERIRAAVVELAIPHPNSETAGMVTISAGVAGAESAESARVPLAEADEALYEAKRAGRNQVRVYRAG